VYSCIKEEEKQVEVRAKNEMQPDGISGGSQARNFLLEYKLEK
jgi:hypothetical protein